MPRVDKDRLDGGLACLTNCPGPRLRAVFHNLANALHEFHRGQTTRRGSRQSASFSARPAGIAPALLEGIEPTAAASVREIVSPAAHRLTHLPLGYDRSEWGCGPPQMAQGTVPSWSIANPHHTHAPTQASPPQPRESGHWGKKG
ncbi:hypothetical protein GQ53DRAFT_748467 [Thozetella sp. PMI_491]|nr:hypothetical protein GQ53DRAFT_748467 [Thozetella sp. PMI_491]